MNSRIKDKIGQIETFIQEMKQIVPDSFDEYKASIEKKAACERYVEKIVEAMIDLAFLTIKSNRLRMPESDTDAFNILTESNIIDEKLATSLKKAKGMRNIIAHEYGEINNQVVFDSIKEQLETDIKSFIQKIKASRK